MPINNNIWELAEAYLGGSLPQAEFVKLKNRLASDSEFANEFYEVTDLIRSVQGNGKQRRFRNMLKDIHHAQNEVKETAPVAAAPQPQSARSIALPSNWWKTAAVAASVAALSSAITVWSLKPSMKHSDSQYNMISRQVEDLKKVQAQQQMQQNQLRDDIAKAKKPTPPPSDVKYTGTGFALTNDGYFVTAYHVIHDNSGYGDSVYIQNHDGQYYKASLVNFDAKADIAIMRIEKSGFRFGKGDLPYTIAKEKAGLGARIYTMGYPKEDVVYSEGYISSNNGFDGNALQYTLELPVGHGQSGSPILDEQGHVLGILTAVGSQGEENTYAVSSTALMALVRNLPDDNNLHLPKVNKMGRMDREDQVEKLQDYTFSVKVYKK